MVAVLPVRNTVSFKIANRLATVAFSGFLIGCDASTTPRPKPSIAPTTESSVSFTQSEKNAMSDEPTVKVYLNPLMTLLAGKERQKGSPLTEAEVLAVRDSAVFVQMTKAQAQKFYESLDSQVPVYRMDPDRIWEEWQEIRDKVEF
jgi:hypothetical protein